MSGFFDFSLLAQQSTQVSPSLHEVRDWLERPPGKALSTADVPLVDGGGKRSQKASSHGWWEWLEAEGLLRFLIHPSLSTPDLYGSCSIPRGPVQHVEAVAVAETVSERHQTLVYKRWSFSTQVNGLRRLELARISDWCSSCSHEIKAEMHHIEAACLYQMGQLDEAEKAIRAAVSIEPLKENYLNTYGVILRKNNRIEQAVRSYELVIKLQPDFADVYYNCGNALNEIDRKKEAVASSIDVLKLIQSMLLLTIIALIPLRDLKDIESA